MDNITINTKTPIDGFHNLDIDYLIERDGEIVIKLNHEDYYQINIGDNLTFMRNIKGENGQNKFYHENVVVKSKDENNLIHTSLLSSKKTYLKRENWYEFYNNESDSYYLINCNEEHPFFAQDLSLGINLRSNTGETETSLPVQELYLKNYKGELIGSFSNISALNKYSKRTLEINDCITHIEKEESCNKEFKYRKIYYYNFLPECEDRHSFILEDFSPYQINDAFYFETKFNMYYYYTINLDMTGKPIELDSYGEPIKHCQFYGDIWFGGFFDTLEKKYVNEGPNISNLYQERAYYNVNLGISNDADEVSLGVEDFFYQHFNDDIKENMIPEFIDMERIKYIPYRQINNTSSGSTSGETGNTRGESVYSYQPVNKITIYPHFRERTILDKNNNTNTFSTSGNLYYDGWYIDTDDEGNQFWNGYDWRVGVTSGNTGFNLFGDFVSTCGKTADLIGYLNFTDNDIFYRKHKVSKSFFRFSFYNSKNPLEQKLLSYSTVFLDSGELYYKFLKQKMFIEFCKDKDNLSQIHIAPIAIDNKNVEVVFCENTDVNSKVDTKITLTNEYDKTRSSEGFNLYLFKEDAPEGNSSKTIYMRIDFNHAGNGKTLPMIIWPKDSGGQYIRLTIDNFLDYLYIPIQIRQKDGKYIYSINGAEYDKEGNIDLILFEPKLDSI